MKTSTKILNNFLIIGMFYLIVFALKWFFESGNYFYFILSICCVEVLFLHLEWYFTEGLK